MKQILITGATGFIGTNLVKRLSIESNLNILGVDSYKVGTVFNHIKSKNIQYLTGDLDIELPKEVIQSKFDVIFHLAAFARIQLSFRQPERYIKNNLNSTLNILEYARLNNTPVIYAGTSSTESNLGGKYKNPYTFSKTVGEEMFGLYKNLYQVKVSVARFFNVYGPYQIPTQDYGTLIGIWMRNIEKKRSCTIYGDGERRRDFTHVEDIVEALYLIFKKEAYGYIFELGRGRNYSINQIAEMFGIIPNYESSRQGEALETLADITLAKECLGWSPKRNIEDYIKEFKQGLKTS